MDFPGLPVEQIVHELPEAEQVCAECGEPLHVCGHQVLHRELAYVPAQYRSICRSYTAAAIVRGRMIMRKSRLWAAGRICGGLTVSFRSSSVCRLHASLGTLFLSNRGKTFYLHQKVSIFIYNSKSTFLSF